MDWQNGNPADQKASNEAGSSISETQVQFYDIKEPVGYALLLGCNTTPSQQHPSPSVREDLNSMEDTLKRIDWKTYSPCLGGTCAVDLTIDSCEQIINNLETPELSRYSCFILYYSGHGVGSGIVGSNGRIVPYKDLVTKISGLKAVEGKPKIFIFDCCRKKAEKELENLQNQFSKLDLSYNEEIEDHLRQDRLTNVYPPPDSILCFSACEGSPSGHTVDKTKGSYFTMKLCHTLLYFGRQLPFKEIVTQVYGGTVAISTNVFGIGQQPVVCSTLNKHLVLSPTDVRLKNRGLEIVTQDSPGVQQLPTSAAPLSLPGATTPGSPTRALDVVSDAATVTGTIQRMVFKTRQDIEQNLTKLGEGVSVFMVYAPDPESPYQDPRTRTQEISANEKQIFQLAYDLEQHGFNVVTDLHLGSEMPANWLKWYMSRIELCNYVILVGSPAFCELFSKEKPHGQIIDERAQRLLSYRNVVYAEIAAEVSRNPGGSKFVPVLLDPRWTFEDSVPSLMRAATVYHLLEDDHRRFNYDDGSRDFEKLVCRMAGINRAEINRPPMVGVHRLPSPFQGGIVQPAPMPVLATKKPRTGYKVIRPTLPPTSGSPATISAPTAVGAVGGHHHHHIYHSPPQPLAGSTGSPVPPAQPALAGQQWHHPHAGMIPSPQHYSQYATVPPNMVYPSSVGSYHHTIPPIQAQQSGTPQQPISQPGVPLPSSLPDIEPDSAMLLWLSERLVGWPFIARYLGFDEPTIERIKEENPHNVSEQCYQMLDKWYRQRPSKFSCQTLGEVLLKSERNKQLFPIFVQRVMALVRTQDMDTSN